MRCQISVSICICQHHHHPFSSMTNKTVSLIISLLYLSLFVSSSIQKSILISMEEEIDLTLKLSPCGKKNAAWLTRSSSSMGAGEKGKSSVENGAKVGPMNVPWMDRSCSLPAEVEKGLMRFGDLQTMRRVKTGKRLLLEKQRRAATVAADRALGNSSGDSWHQGGASSNIQTSPKQEIASMVPPKTMVEEMPVRPSDTKLDNPVKKLKPVNPCVKGDAMDILTQMPSVTTTGDGPSGKKIEGLLYKYRRGQVCIVCVCHGSFLSPAEFVMHAGGKEVENPMKHITVCSNSF